MNPSEAVFQVAQYNGSERVQVFSTHATLEIAVREAQRRSRKIPAGSNRVAICAERIDGQPIDREEMQVARDAAERPQ
jgi:uncharacterized protein YqhQ